MSSRAKLSEVEEMLNNIISYSAGAHRNLPCITLKKSQYEVFKKFNKPDPEGSYWFKNILLKPGNY